MRSSAQKKWFSTIIAILMTTFLTILSASILNLFLVENGMNHFLSDGISAYMSAEWALEYTLLKSANHREGFSDTITDADIESTLLDNSSLTNKKTTIASTLRASDRSYTGVIVLGGFEIIPLFYDGGSVIQNTAKNPNKENIPLIKTSSFIVSQDGDIGWNIIGNDTMGKTFGIAGTGWIWQSFGNMMSANIQSGFEKHTDASDLMTAGTETIGNFLTIYENNYLILSNTSSGAVTYSIVSPDTFALPVRSIIASSTVGKSKQNIEFSENRSKLFDILKYSVFSK